MVLEKDRLFHQRSFANSNSTHALGLLAQEEILNTESKIKDILNLSNHHITFTSGATEANNLALKGVAKRYLSKGNHIITTPFEHGSITSTLNDLARNGYIIDVVEMDEFGLVNLEDLESLMTEQTILVSIGLVNSELGILQNIKEISKIIKKFPNALFHSDITQAVGKIKLVGDLPDLMSFSGHKIYGFKGIGALLHRQGVDLYPVIHGGRSQSIYRGGTPPTSLIYSLGVALEHIYRDFDQKSNHIDSLHQQLIDGLKKIPSIVINSNQYSINQIVNFSFLGAKSKEVQTYLSNRDIFISTFTACASHQDQSQVVMGLTKDIERSMSSLRVSLSYLTTSSEVEELLRALEDYHEGR